MSFVSYPRRRLGSLLCQLLTISSETPPASPLTTNCSCNRNDPFSFHGVPTVICFINVVHATFAASFLIESSVGFKITMNGFLFLENLLYLRTPTLEQLRDLPGASFWVPLGVLDDSYSLLEDKLLSLSFDISDRALARLPVMVHESLGYFCLEMSAATFTSSKNLS